jgi:hypothetical protein
MQENDQGIGFLRIILFGVQDPVREAGGATAKICFPVGGKILCTCNLRESAENKDHYETERHVLKI